MDHKPIDSAMVLRYQDFLPRLQELTATAITITSELDLDRVLQLIADTASTFIGSRYAALGIINDDGMITQFITCGLSLEERERLGAPPRGHGLLGLLIQEGKPLRVPDIQRNPHRSGFPPHHPPMTTLLGVPVSIGLQVVGDLYVTDKIGADAFSAEDEAWLMFLAQQAAVAIQNARLYATAQREKQRAQMLADLIGTLNRNVDVTPLFQQITHAACELLRLPAAALYIFSQPHNRFDLQAHIGLRVEDGGEAFIPLGRSVAGDVWTSGKTITVDDTQSLSHIFFLPLSNAHYPRALIVTPIRLDGHITGVIEAYSVQPRRFSAEEVALIETFADHAALAIHRTELYRQREDFLSMIAHDLRAPLTVIKMSAGLLEVSLASHAPPALLRLAKNIGHNSDRLDALLSDLLEITRLEQGQVRLKMADVEIGEMITAATATLAPLFEAKAQRLVFVPPARPLVIRADRQRLEQVLVNLLTNAHKYTPFNGQVHMSMREAHEWLTLAVADSGPGIPPSDQAHIFERYYRRPIHALDKHSSGSGLGLPIARSLVELHGGTLSVESVVGQGSTFVVRLPCHATTTL